ncbi:MAG: phenylacetate--CoA ligase family protein, partial [Planctomycetota bacterium]
CELVLTTLGRVGGPAIRYRTGDLVRPCWDHPQSVSTGHVWLDGGVISRADDMVVIRGVNIFPSSIESIVRGVEGCGEYQIVISKRGEMDQIRLDVECDQPVSQQLSDALAVQLGLRVPVRQVPDASLPRSHAKSKRLVDER